MRSPVWNGNEVWLLAAAVDVWPFRSLRGELQRVYLALMIVLWLLSFAARIEFGPHRHDMWRQAWDVASRCRRAARLLFAWRSQRAPRRALDERGEFQGRSPDVERVRVARRALSVALLSMHARWVAVKTEGPCRRARGASQRALWRDALLAAMIAASFVVRPDFTANFAGIRGCSLRPSSRRRACHQVLSRPAGRPAPFARSGADRRPARFDRRGLYPRLLPPGRKCASGARHLQRRFAEGSLRTPGIYLWGLPVALYQ